jgi:hypothetical protein
MGVSFGPKLSMKFHRNSAVINKYVTQALAAKALCAFHQP